MRQFKHLSSEKKRSIIVGFLADEPKLSIARRLEIDNSTVHYHINKIKHLSEPEIIQLIAPKCAGCGDGHPSFKCLVCGTAHDNIKSEEFHEIRRLRAANAELTRRLALYEKPDPDTDAGPVVTVRL